MSGSTPTFPPPNTSPESLSRTRLYGLFTWQASARQRALSLSKGDCLSCGALRQAQGACCSARFESYEPLDLHASGVEQLAHRRLVVGHRGLIEQHDVLVVGVHPALDDPRHGLGRLVLLL